MTKFKKISSAMQTVKEILSLFEAVFIGEQQTEDGMVKTIGGMISSNGCMIPVLVDDLTSCCKACDRNGALSIQVGVVGPKGRVEYTKKSDGTLSDLRARLQAAERYCEELTAEVGSDG